MWEARFVIGVQKTRLNPSHSLPTASESVGSLVVNRPPDNSNDLCPSIGTCNVCNRLPDNKNDPSPPIDNCICWKSGLSSASKKVIYQSPLILTELFQHNLIHVSYLTACYLYQVMMTLHFLNDVANDVESTQKQKLRHNR